MTTGGQESRKEEDGGGGEHEGKCKGKTGERRRLTIVIKAFETRSMCHSSAIILRHFRECNQQIDSIVGSTIQYNRQCTRQ
jgi:hypothetical protein